MLCKKKKNRKDGESNLDGKTNNDDEQEEDDCIDTSFLPINFDYKKDYVVRCLNANKHNHITTSYYLLLKKY